MVEKLGAIVFIIVFMLAFATFGGYFISWYSSDTVTISNAPSATPGVLSDPGAIETPSTLSALSWAFNSLGFIFGLSAFTVSGVPIIFSLVAWVIDAIAVAVLILIIRGN